MTERALKDLGWFDFRAAAWWLGLLYRRPKHFREALEELPKMRMVQAGIILITHALIYAILIAAVAILTPLPAVAISRRLRLASSGNSPSMIGSTCSDPRERLALGIAFGIAEGIALVIAVRDRLRAAFGIAAGITSRIAGGFYRWIAVGIVEGIRLRDHLRDRLRDRRRNRLRDRLRDRSGIAGGIA